MQSTAVEPVDVVEAELLDDQAAALAPRASLQVAAALAAYVRNAVAETVPDTTRRALVDDGRAFEQWCTAAGLTPWPATADVLAAYVKHLTTAPRPPRAGRKPDARPLGPASIARRISSVRTLHRAARLTPPDTLDARRILDGYRHALALAKSEQARPRKASPAMPAELRAMLGTLDRNTFTGARDAALLLLGYATAARVSELVALDLDDVRVSHEGLLVSMYRKKVKKLTETAVPYGSNPATCPVRAFLALRELLAADDRTAGPLFVRVDRHGRLASPMYRHGKPIGDPSGRITTEAAATVVARAADAAGLTGQWSGHSLRRGFATAARRAGHDMEVIGRHGGWADGSAALVGYIEEADQWTTNPVSGL